MSLLPRRRMEMRGEEFLISFNTVWPRSSAHPHTVVVSRRDPFRGRKPQEGDGYIKSTKHLPFPKLK